VRLILKKMFEIRYKNHESGKVEKSLVEKAADITDAITAANMMSLSKEDVYGLNLSVFREVFLNPSSPNKFFDVTVRSFDDKPVKYHILIESISAERAMVHATELMKQGYEMEPISIKESDIKNVMTADIEQA